GWRESRVSKSLQASWMRTEGQGWCSRSPTHARDAGTFRQVGSSLFPLIAAPGLRNVTLQGRRIHACRVAAIARAKQDAPRQVPIEEMTVVDRRKVQPPWH